MVYLRSIAHTAVLGFAREMEDPIPMPVNPQQLPTDLAATGFWATIKRKNKASNMGCGACDNFLFVEEGSRK